MKPLLTALLLLPTVTLAETYGNTAGCNRVNGQPEGSDSVAIFRPGENLEFWESTCPITGFTMVGAGATVVTVQCSGEGDTWEAYYMLETTEDDGFTLYPEDNPDARTALARCD
ncbi:hypothetical protein [Sagittula sp. S175]|uniref:hypothetical protein n=1 Tax=Sagittula sp. S175 TaxID=3415129 RepID=UPI003C7A3A99